LKINNSNLVEKEDFPSLLTIEIARSRGVSSAPFETAVAFIG
jgi:hypothetical protein